MTSSNHLLRSHAPIPTDSWAEIDGEAKSRLSPLLAARRIVDWSGPNGWTEDRFSIGRTTPVSGGPGTVDAAADGVRLLQRKVLPYAEVRVPFTVSRGEIQDIERGALDAELDDLDRAVRAAAVIENRAVVHGWADAGIAGLTAAASYPAVELGEDSATYPTRVASAVDTMRNAGIGGPYALAIEPSRYTRIVETAEHGGYLLVEHLSRILGGPVVWAPGVDGAVLVTQRGGDFTLSVGQDWSIGYDFHDAEYVHLYLEESFTFFCAEPDGVLALS